MTSVTKVARTKQCEPWLRPSQLTSELRVFELRDLSKSRNLSEPLFPHLPVGKQGGYEG